MSNRETSKLSPILRNIHILFLEISKNKKPENQDIDKVKYDLAKLQTMLTDHDHEQTSVNDFLLIGETIKLISKFRQSEISKLLPEAKEAEWLTLFNDYSQAAIQLLFGYPPLYKELHQYTPTAPNLNPLLEPLSAKDIQGSIKKLQQAVERANNSANQLSQLGAKKNQAGKKLVEQLQKQKFQDPKNKVSLAEFNEETINKLIEIFAINAAALAVLDYSIRLQHEAKRLLGYL